MFKVGDKIKCVYNAGWEFALTVGNIYTVLDNDGFVAIERDDRGHFNTRWESRRFELCTDPQAEKRKEIEQAMDVFEKHNLMRSQNNKYQQTANGKPAAAYITRNALLGKLFPTEKHTKLQELQEQIKELRKTANELEKEINE